MEVTEDGRPPKINREWFRTRYGQSFPDLLPADKLELTVKDLEKQGKATIHDKMVFFQNGKIIEEKPVVKENLTTEKPKKEKKTKAVPVKDIKDLAAEAEIVPIEEVEDESEGF